MQKDLTKVKIFPKILRGGGYFFSETPGRHNDDKTSTENVTRQTTIPCGQM